MPSLATVQQSHGPGTELPAVLVSSTSRIAARIFFKKSEENVSFASVVFVGFLLLVLLMEDYVIVMIGYSI